MLCGLGDGEPPAQPEDDVAALGALLVHLLGTDETGEPIPERRWRGHRAWTGWDRRALLLLADQAAAEPPTRRPTARRLAAAIADAVPGTARIDEPPIAAPSSAGPGEVHGIDRLRATALVEVPASPAPGRAVCHRGRPRGPPAPRRRRSTPVRRRSRREPATVEAAATGTTGHHADRGPHRRPRGERRARGRGSALPGGAAGRRGARRRLGLRRRGHAGAPAAGHRRGLRVPALDRRGVDGRRARGPGGRRPGPGQPAGRRRLPDARGAHLRRATSCP